MKTADHAHYLALPATMALENSSSLLHVCFQFILLYISGFFEEIHHPRP